MAGHGLETTVWHVIGLGRADEICVVTLDSRLHQGGHDLRKSDPLFVRSLRHFTHDILHMGVHVALLSRVPSIFGMTPAWRRYPSLVDRDGLQPLSSNDILH